MVILVCIYCLVCIIFLLYFFLLTSFAVVDTTAYRALLENMPSMAVTVALVHQQFPHGNKMRWQKLKYKIVYVIIVYYCFCCISFECTNK